MYQFLISHRPFLKTDNPKQLNDKMFFITSFTTTKTYDVEIHEIQYL